MGRGISRARSASVARFRMVGCGPGGLTHPTEPGGHSSSSTTVASTVASTVGHPPNVATPPPWQLQDEVPVVDLQHRHLCLCGDEQPPELENTHRMAAKLWGSSNSADLHPDGRASVAGRWQMHRPIRRDCPLRAHEQMLYTAYTLNEAVSVIAPSRGTIESRMPPRLRTL